MKNYYFSIPVQDGIDKDVIFTADTDSESFIVQASWEDDPESSSKGHWVFIIDRIIDEDNTEERSVVVNPGSVYFQYDDIYSLIVYSDKDAVGREDLKDIVLIFSIRGEE